jgi:hypothetical protein
MNTGITPRLFQTPYGVRLAFTTIGFGTAPLGNMYRPPTEQDARGALDAAWDNGAEPDACPRKTGRTTERRSQLGLTPGDEISQAGMSEPAARSREEECCPMSPTTHDSWAL